MLRLIDSCTAIVLDTDLLHLSFGFMNGHLGSHVPVESMCFCGHDLSFKSMDQPGKVANPSCGQLNRGNEYHISLSPFAPENFV